MNIRIIKRSDMPKRQETIIRIAAVLMSIVFAGLIFRIFFYNLHINIRSWKYVCIRMTAIPLKIWF